MVYKDIPKVKEALTKSYYKQLNDIIIQGVTFFSAPIIMDYLQHCINEISSYYDSVLNDSVTNDYLKHEEVEN